MENVGFLNTNQAMSKSAGRKSTPAPELKPVVGPALVSRNSTAHAWFENGRTPLGGGAESLPRDAQLLHEVV